MAQWIVAPDVLGDVWRCAVERADGDFIQHLPDIGIVVLLLKAVIFLRFQSSKLFQCNL